MIQTLPPLPLCPVLSLSAHAAAPGEKKKKKKSSGDNHSSPTSHLPPDAPYARLPRTLKPPKSRDAGPSVLRRFVLLAERTRRPLGTCSSPRGRHTISAKTSTPAPSGATCHSAPRNCHLDLARWCRLRSKLQGWGCEPRLSKHLDALHFQFCTLNCSILNCCISLCTLLILCFVPSGVAELLSEFRCSETMKLQ